MDRHQTSDRGTGASSHQRATESERATMRRALRSHGKVEGNPMTAQVFSGQSAAPSPLSREAAAVISVTHAVPFDDATVSYEINGAAGAPVVAILGGIS